MRALINGRIITENEVLDNKVIVFDEKIQAIMPEEEFKDTIRENTISDLQIIDAEKLYISPGFIDIHIHGSGGHDTMDGEPEDIYAIGNVIARNGVTGFLPTTMTMDKAKIYKALGSIKECMNADSGGAAILGAHLEGPFINEKYKGAQKEDFIIQPDYNFIEKYKDVIRIITIAPEKDLNYNFIKQVKENTEIVLSIGHSNATYEEAMEAVKAGISSATHTFNAMTPFNHRNPGIVGAVFNSDIFCEVIADTIHVHPAVFQTLVKIKGKDKIILVTDSMRAGCMEDGISELGGQKVIVKNDSARLEDGTLAGSILKLNKAVKNFRQYTDLRINEVINMVSINPARAIGNEKETGSLEQGKYSDIILFDEDIDIKQTIIRGRTVFKK